jgi:hypothetical protein
MVHHSNDGPLGVLNSAGLQLPDEFTGYWVDLHWIGASGGSAPISITYLLLWILKPVGFAKFYPPLSMLILGVCAWTFFRTIGLNKGLSIVGAIAAALNSNFFSNTAWGLGTRALTLAMAFLALSVLSTKRAGNPWLNAALAGLCVGMGIIEGADNGAIFSVFIGAFVLWQAWIEEGPVKKKILGGLRVVVVAVFAGFMAAQVLITLVGIASQNVGGPKEAKDPEAAARDWDFATQWSLPPVESLRVIIPGLYGYRMDTPEGGNYWGRVGEAPGAPQLAPRYSGAGEYAGVLVVLIAFWALFTSLNKSLGIFSITERKLIWFWSVMAFVALLFSWGRHAPFYQFVYALPIQNHPQPDEVHAPGAHGHHDSVRLWPPGTEPALLRKLAGQGDSVRKRWKVATFALAAAAVLSFLIYTGARSTLEKHLMNVGFADPDFAAAIARFSVHDVGLFVVFLFLALGALFLIIRGAFTGARARWAVVILGLLVTVDLARANQPWIIYWNYPRSYASNPIIDILKEKPYEGRVVAPPGLSSAQGIQLPPLTRQFAQIYGVEWVQHHFQYYNIQSIDVAQDPRPPADKKAYMNGVTKDIGRYWELTNTRWVLGLAGYLNVLNAQVDKGRNRFRIAALFDIAPKPDLDGTDRLEGLQDLTAVPTTNGPLALFEYTAALPRARLYTQWLVMTNGDEALAKLVDPTFDPATAVIVSDNIPTPSANASNPAPATVEFASYAPKKIELKSNASVPTVLLLNDRFDPDWKVTVDGQPATLLRANFIMRGVQLPAGQHTIVFRYEPSLRGMKVTLAALVIALLLCGYLAASRRKSDGVAAPDPASQPSRKPKT